MFCPICWKEYPKGMRHCDSCRAELVEEKPEGLKEDAPNASQKPGDEANKETGKEK